MLYHEIQKNIIAGGAMLTFFVPNFYRFFKIKLLSFVVVICDLVHNVTTKYNLRYLLAVSENQTLWKY